MYTLLEKPIIFLDIESTGLDREQDRIVELCLIKLYPDMKREIHELRFNPGKPIPKEASDIHGITDEMVKDMPPFIDVAKQIFVFMEGCDVAGFNSNSYDIPMLFFEFQRAGLFFPYHDIHMVDVGNIFKIMEQRTLEAAVKFYLKREHKGAHGAKADVEATIDVFKAQLKEYGCGIPQSIRSLAKFSNYDNELVDISGKFTKDKNGVILFNFGKHRGQPAKNHPDFLEWMLYKANFNADTCRVASEILEPTSDEELDFDEDQDEEIRN